MISVVLGTQWGDEGKAKVVDYLSGDYDYVVRFQGGANAGHTVIVDEKKYVFHLVPSGILHSRVHVVIGNGVVIDLEEFLKELDMITGDVDVTGRVSISNRAQIVMPYHKLMDGAKEDASGNKIGTTRRGIGPTYVDKADRLGIRVGDLFVPGLKEKVERAYEIKKYLFENYYGLKEIPTVDGMVAWLEGLAERIKPYVADTERLIINAHRFGKDVLFEGAQGSLLDVDFGTYPFVTSSNTIAGGLFSGSGMGYVNNMKIVGIAKAYTTRVGEGPFPTEDFGESGEALRKAGGEYGATTGRPRRCGWFDGIYTRYSMSINGVTDVFLTKLDVLDGMEWLNVCVGYELDGKRLDYPPSTTDEIERVSPIYKTLPGWKEKTMGIKDYGQLPENAKKYIDFLESVIETKVTYISTGFEREDVIVK